MILKATAPFGNFKPGDTVEVPDGATYDTAYFTLAESKGDKSPDKSKEKEGER